MKPSTCCEDTFPLLHWKFYAKIFYIKSNWFENLNVSALNLCGKFSWGLAYLDQFIFSHKHSSHTTYVISTFFHMRSYFVPSIHLLPYSCMRAAKALMSLSICTKFPEPSLLAMISTKIPCTCPYLGCTIAYTDELMLNEPSFACTDPDRDRGCGPPEKS